MMDNEDNVVEDEDIDMSGLEGVSGTITRSSSSNSGNDKKKKDTSDKEKKDKSEEDDTDDKFSDVDSRDVKVVNTVDMLESWESEYGEIWKGLVSFKVPRSDIEKGTKRQVQSALDIAGVKHHTNIRPDDLSVVMTKEMYKHLKQYRNSVVARAESGV